MKRYTRIVDISIDHLSDKYLFRRLVKTTNGQKLRGSANLSYSSARELVLDMLQSHTGRRGRLVPSFYEPLRHSTIALE